MAETKQEVKHTALPWSQGRTLDTHATRRYTASEWRMNEDTERRHVFANFSAQDEGRSRVHIAQFDRQEDAEACVRAVNNFEGMLGALEACQLQLLQSNNTSEYAQEANDLANEAIRAAKQGR